MRPLVLIVLAVAAGASTPPATAAQTSDPSPTAYWQIRTCAHPHREGVARSRIISILTSTDVLTRARWKHVWHYAVCVKYRKSHLRLRSTIKRFMAERRTRTFEILFARYPAWVHSHLVSIAACESGGNPRAVSSTGAYRGKYQFSFSTWKVVGGSGDPAAAPEAEQDYRAARLLTEHGAGHWPVCG